MNVKNSNIPEEGGKPLFESKNWKEVKGDKVKTFLDEEDEEEDEEGDRYKKSMLALETGVVINIFDIQSIDIDIRFVEKPSAHWEYGITINKGVLPSSFVKRVDISVWYSTPELRDMKYESLLSKLEESGFNIIKM